MSRAADRRAARLARKEAKAAARAERIALRQKGRSGRASGRQDVRSTAYEQGFNPNSFISDIVGSVGETVVGVAGAKSGAAGAGSAGSKKLFGGDDVQSLTDKIKENPAIAVGAGVGLFALAKAMKWL